MSTSFPLADQYGIAYIEDGVLSHQLAHLVVSHQSRGCDSRNNALDCTSGEVEQAVVVTSLSGQGGKRKGKKGEKAGARKEPQWETGLQEAIKGTKVPADDGYSQALATGLTRR